MYTQEKSMPLDDLVSVLVPRPLLADVYALVVEHERSAHDADTDASTETEAEPELTSELVRRMYLESQDTHQRLMKFLASRPGEWVFTAEIAQELELAHGARSSAGMFGAFGRRAAHRYDGLKPWDEEWVPEKHQVHYRMTAEVAGIINSL
jgi:hypothetical protein